MLIKLKLLPRKLQFHGFDWWYNSIRKYQIQLIQNPKKSKVQNQQNYSMGGQQGKVTYGYWGVRARGQIGRLLLAYCGAEWDEVKYLSPDQWFGGDKQKLGLDFPNLPYLIDGELKITQTGAIEKHIAKRAGKGELLGQNLDDKAKVNMLLGVLLDFREALLGLVFDKEFQSKKKGVWEKLKPKVQALQKFAGTKNFIMGYLTIPDFYIAEYANYFEKVFPEEFKSFPSFSRIRQNFNNQPQIVAYYSKETAVKGPFLPPYAAVKM